MLRNQFEPLDSIDQVILAERLAARAQIGQPCIGDYVRFQTGELERISHDHGAKLQTSPLWAGSFYLLSNGNASFSGGLNPCIPQDSLALTDEVMPDAFWFFHHSQSGPGRGVRFSVPCRIYDTTAKYDGYLTKG